MYAVQGFVTAVVLGVGLAGCGIFEPEPFAVEQDQIYGYYAVVSTYNIKSRRTTDLSRGPYTFGDTTMAIFYPEQIVISGNHAQSLWHKPVTQGTFPNWTYTYHYSERAEADIVWRASEDGSTIVGQFNWKTYNGDSAVYATSVDYMSFDGIGTKDGVTRMSVTYCDNATRMRDPWLAESNNDPVYFTETWMKIDSAVYNSFKRKAWVL